MIVWPRRKQFLHLNGVGIDMCPGELIEAILTLSGMVVEKVRMTVSDQLSRLPLIGRRFPLVTSCPARAFKMSSSLSLIVTTNMTPFFMAAELLGWVPLIGLPPRAFIPSRAVC